MESEIPFHNVPIDLTQLPQVADVESQALQRRYLRQRLLSNSLLFTVLLVGLLVLMTQLGEGASGWELAGALGAWALLFGVVQFMAVKGFRYKSYALREHDILYRSGWLWRTETVIPFNRVQHCEVSQGPIEKWLKLAELKVFTAGGQSADLSIPGISPEEAQQLKEYVIKRTGANATS